MRTFLILALAFAGVAYAQDAVTDLVPPGTDQVTWAIELLLWIAQKLQRKEWAGALAGACTLLTFLVNFFGKDRIPSNLLPWISGGLGVVGAVATNAAALAVGAPALAWVDAIGIGLFSGGAGVGIWEMAGKHLTGPGGRIVGVLAGAAKKYFDSRKKQ